MDLQTLYQKAIKFAGEKHENQKVPGSQSSYLVHLSNVAMEIMLAAQHTDNFDRILPYRWRFCTMYLKILPQHLTN